MSADKILVSACLLGARVRFDGNAKTVANELLSRWLAEGRVIPVCPEVEGGLPVPRPPAEIQGGSGAQVLSGLVQIRTKSGADVTAAFVAGAQKALALATQHDARIAILKARSPSCGSGGIYDGTFTGTLRDGEGVTAALLRAHGIAVFSEEELDRVQALLTPRR